MSVRKLLIAAAFAVVAACAPKTEPAETPAAPPPDVQAAASGDSADIAGCAARGGVVERVGRMQREVCRVPYADAGKTCRNKSDCTARCLLEKPADPETKAAVAGKCQRYETQFGCFSEVDGGRVTMTMCVD